MGNYCCSDDEEQVERIPVLRKKVSLNRPSVKERYEDHLKSLLNKALEKYQQEKSVSKFRIKGELGKGGQGSVLLVKVTFTQKNGDIFTHTYALKLVSKTKLDTQSSRRALLFENEILITHKSNFLCQIYYAFQDNSYLYYLMEIALGGDLFSFIRFHNDTTTDKAQLWELKKEEFIVFIVAGVVCGLEYLHSKNIIYRDLKCQNVLILKDGYPKLADFGISRRNQNTPCYDIKGTILYLAPQMVSKKGYDWSIDLWALGVLTYELIFKQPPFSSVDISSPNFQTKCQRWEYSPTFHDQVSQNAKSFITSLLKVKKEERLGYNGYEQIKSHPFFEKIDWENYQNKLLESPLQDIIAKNPITDKITPVISQNLQIDEREYVPFTFVKGAKSINQARETSDVSPSNQFRPSQSVSAF